MTTKLIIDCDTGTDDAVAIMAAALHPALRLIGVTTVSGNVPLPNTTENSLRVLDHIGAAVPVYAGAARPLVRADLPIPRATMNAGNPAFQIAYLDLPPSQTPVQVKSASAFLIDTYLGDLDNDAVLVAVGPLTNLAAALAAEPRLAARIPRLVIMGGAVAVGNVTARAEFNFWADPEAAAAVLNAGIRDVVIVPLDATHAASVTIQDCDMFDAIGTPAALASSAFVRHRIATYRDGADAKRLSAPVHDAVCVAYLVHPEVLQDIGAFPVHVETAGGHTLAEMIVDKRPWSSLGINARVAECADAQVFVRFLADAFAA